MSEKNSNKLIFTRKELYELVWSKPITSLAEELGISGPKIRDVCKKHEIPTPKQGHWMKLKHGKPTSKTPLPQKNNEVIEIKKQSRTKTKEKDIGITYKVPNKLSNPHPLVKKAKEIMNKQHAGFYGKGIDVVYSAGKCLATEVTKPNIPRGLRLWDALIKLILKRGHKISDSKDSEFLILGEEFTIRVREILKRVKVEDSNWERYEKAGSGILSVKVHKDFRTYEWRNSKKKSIETQLLDIVLKLEDLARKEKQDRIERRKWRKKFEEEQAIKKEREERVATEISNFKKLFETASRWHKSQYLRNYIKEFETYAINTSSLNIEKRDWIEWAREKADWYDPFVEKEVDLLKDIDRESLKQKSNW